MTLQEWLASLDVNALLLAFLATVFCVILYIAFTENDDE